MFLYEVVVYIYIYICGAIVGVSLLNYNFIIYKLLVLLFILDVSLFWHVAVLDLSPFWICLHFGFVSILDLSPFWICRRFGFVSILDLSPFCLVSELGRAKTKDVHAATSTVHVYNFENADNNFG